MKSIQTAGVESLQESYIYSVHVWDPLVRIYKNDFKEWLKAQGEMFLSLVT